MRPLSLLAALAILVLQTAAAFAHAALVSSDPADGAVLAAAPSRLVLTFNEPVSPLFLRLVDDQGQTTQLSYHLEGTAVVVDAPGAVSKGSHALSWRVISEDGHPVGGSVLFSVGAPSAGAVPGSAEVIDWPLRIAIWCCRLLLYLGLFVGIGGVFFGIFISRDARPGQRIEQALMVLAAFSVPIALGLQGLDALDLPLSDFARGMVWHTAFGTSYAVTLGIALLALVAGLAASIICGAPAATLAVLALVGVGLALAASGHASAAPPQWLTRPAVFVHAAAVAFWVGALIPLGALLHRGEGQNALARFSRTIPFAIVPLVVAGIALAVVQVETPALLLTTAYGRVLLVKLALVALLFLLAAINRWRLTRPAERGEPSATRRLAAAIVIEAALAFAILATVATWRFTPPPRAIETAAAQPALVHIHTAKAMAEITVTPGRTGPVSVSIAI
ncbi:MAG: copper resistance protein CopC, partial [Rhizobiales bacterium]|nr:copper resistance protein CopC [Hyphomicrobiales bacterium]